MYTTTITARDLQHIRNFAEVHKNAYGTGYTDTVLSSEHRSIRGITFSIHMHSGDVVEIQDSVGNFTDTNFKNLVNDLKYTIGTYESKTPFLSSTIETRAIFDPESYAKERRLRKLEEERELERIYDEIDRVNYYAYHELDDPEETPWPTAVEESSDEDEEEEKEKPYIFKGKGEEPLSCEIIPLGDAGEIFADIKEDRCPICLDNDNKAWCKSGDCRHEFHKDCFLLIPLIDKCRKCPLCRTQIKYFNCATVIHFNGATLDNIGDDEDEEYEEEEED